MGLFLDSGAFSAYTQGVVIDIDTYINFIKLHLDHIDVYANLDVIGDAQATYENQKYMESQGLNPLPVYHVPFEDPDIWFRKYFEQDYNYIALGGMAGKDVDRGALVKRLDYLFDHYICNTPDRMPAVKTHGFGVTSLDLLKRYPWYSVDSTSWVMTSRTGAIMVPASTDGQYDYTKQCYKIGVSERSIKSDKFNYQNGLSPALKKYVDNFIAKKGWRMGLSRINDIGEVVVVTEGLCNNYKARDIVNIDYYNELQKALPEYPWSFKLNKNKRSFL